MRGVVEAKVERKAELEFIAKLEGYNRNNFWQPICEPCAINARRKGELKKDSDIEQFKNMAFLHDKSKRMVAERKMGVPSVYVYMINFKCPLGHGWSKELELSLIHI